MRTRRLLTVPFQKFGACSPTLKPSSRIEAGHESHQVTPDQIQRNPALEQLLAQRRCIREYPDRPVILAHVIGAIDEERVVLATGLSGKETALYLVPVGYIQHIRHE